MITELGLKYTVVILSMPEAFRSINSISLSVALSCICEFEKTTGLHIEECRMCFCGGHSHALIIWLMLYCIMSLQTSNFTLWLRNLS